MRLLIATGNAGKLVEFRRILARPGLELLSPGPDHPLPECAETGESFAENALIKVRAAVRATGLPAVGDDSGLVVDAFDGAPGIRSSRYFGPGLSDAEKYRRLLELLVDVPDPERTARFVCVAALVLPDGRSFLREGTCEGRILRAPRGRKGFGYDPVFLVPELGLSFAELDQDQKAAISHRGRALRKIAAVIEELIAGRSPAPTEP